MSVWEHINDVIGTDVASVHMKSKKKKKFLHDCGGCDIVITRNGVKISKYVLCDLGIHRKIINRFTVNVPTITGYVKKISNHYTDAASSCYIFPRFGFLAYVERNFKNYNVINKIGLGKRPSTPFKWTGEFKNNQPIIADHIMENIFNKPNAKAGLSGCVLNLQAGQGKSFLATGLIEKIQRKTLVICHNKTIMYQWIDILRAAYPNNTVAHYYGGGKKNDGDIVVGIINSLLTSPMHNIDGVVEPRNFYKKFGYVILDEVHEYVSKSRKVIYQLAQSTYMLGLSATPDERVDGLDIINTWQCGQTLNASELKGYTEDDIPFKGDVIMVKYKGSPDFTKIITNEALDIVSFSQMVTQLCEDYHRIHLIVKLVFELRRSGKNVFVFADRRAYLETIRIELNKFNIMNKILNDDGSYSIDKTTNNKPTTYTQPIDDIKSTRLVGGATSDEIKYTETHSNVILTTYQFMGTGKSIPKMDAIILTTPRKRKSKQYIGRIFRLGSDYTSTRKIVDIVDWNTPIKSQWYKRKLFYDEMMYPIYIRDVNYTDIEEEMIGMEIFRDKNDNFCDGNSVSKSLNELEKLLEQNNILDSECIDNNAILIDDLENF